MKKIFILMSILFATISCSKQSDTNVVEKLNDVYKVEYLNFKVVTIDSCEYLIGGDSSPYQGYDYMTHKGNCKYCAERRKRELKNAK